MTHLKKVIYSSHATCFHLYPCHVLFRLLTKTWTLVLKLFNFKTVIKHYPFNICKKTNTNVNTYNPNDIFVILTFEMCKLDFSVKNKQNVIISTTIILFTDKLYIVIISTDDFIRKYNPYYIIIYGCRQAKHMQIICVGGIQYQMKGVLSSILTINDIWCELHQKWWTFHP